VGKLVIGERGLSIAHTTIMRWVQRYAPEFERRRNRFPRMAGRSWRVDETYMKIRGEWVYRYRAVDRELSAELGVPSSRAFGLFGDPLRYPD
jgi:transposase-like protein